MGGLRPALRRRETPNEVNRHGYVVEVNPWDPNSKPVKHSAMGRFKHEGANVYVTDDGTVVATPVDDERFDYMYKFVSSKKGTARDHRRNPWRTT